MTDLLLTGIRIWDGEVAEPSPERRSIRVRNGIIESIETWPCEGIETRQNAKVFHLDDAFAIPGLIDAHVHLCLDPARRGEPVGGLERESETVAASAVGDAALEARRQRARAMVRAGITTARDLGGGAWLELRLRDEIEAGRIPGPRLLCAGQPLTTRGGHCHFWGGEVDPSSPEALEGHVARQVEAGADWIKVMATGGVLTQGSRAVSTQFDADSLARVVECAASLERSVAAHCHGTGGIAAAAVAGVRTIEHASFAGAEGFGADFQPSVADSIARAGAWVCPTVNAGWGRRARANESPSPFFERMSRALQGLRNAGVQLIASSDAGIPGVEHHQLPRAIAALALYAGMSPFEALQSATSRAAEAIGLGGKTGRLRVGYRADMVVYDRNPLEDLTVLESPKLVVAAGRVVFVASPVGAKATGGRATGR